MRVLGRVRLSRLTEESTSLNRQRELIEKWADMHDHTVVGWAEDVDVSGSVDPFEAPQLGPWFNEENRDKWDILVAWKLDRIGRRAIPLNKVFGWMLEHEKTLVCVSDNIDLSTWVGRLVANVLAGVAEGEIEAIKERTKASRKKLLESGRWTGGPVPYWLIPEKLPEGGWVLSLNTETAPILRRVVDEVLEGSAVHTAAERLNDKGIPSPGGSTWTSQTLWRILQHKYLKGHSTDRGKTVRDSSGVPISNCEALLTPPEWDQLQAVLAAMKLPETSNRTKNTSPLLGVVVCFICDKPLYYRSYTRNYGKGLYRSYYCRNHRTPGIDADELEGFVEEKYLQELEHEHVRDRQFIPAENHQIELDEAVRAVEELTSLLGTITSTTMRSSLMAQLTALDSRISNLERLPSSESRWEIRELEQTYGDVWRSNDDPQFRRRWLVKSGIVVAATKLGGLQMEIRFPPNILEILARKGTT
ncbi:recombinase family protein [Mycobacteroides chelonae]|uniref:recombinase family protein n=1 Tax=Mycobacteroides chelonae TaxID=1774 RepID=UPI000992926E|nr:recombinase family protein [Mycobacteroides chelonae]